MTKEQFDNQQWYKNMPVWIMGQKHYVFAVDFITRNITVTPRINSGAGSTWDCSLVSASPHPSALDLIAKEREKQIKKGYTVEHDAEYVKRTGVGYDTIAVNLIHRYQCPPEWNNNYWGSLCALPYIDRLRIAGTWFARHLEVLLYLEQKEVNNG